MVGPRIYATEAGGRPITAPDTAPKMTTKAMAAATFAARVQRMRQRRAATNETTA